MSNADWWAKRLGNAPSQQPPVAPQQFVQQPVAPMPSQYQQPYAQVPQEPATKAQSARSTETCPMCGSGNFMRANPSVVGRCFECGYPLEQSGSAVGSLAGARVEGATLNAKGNDTTNNYNPTEIIGHVG